MDIEMDFKIMIWSGVAIAFLMAIFVYIFRHTFRQSKLDF